MISADSRYSRGLDVEREQEKAREHTRARVDSFRKSLRSHAVAPNESSLAMAIDVHDVPQPGIDSSILSQPRSKTTNNFARNVVLGMSLVAACVWSLNETKNALNSAQVVLEQSAQAEKSPRGAEEPRLDKTDFVLENDLSGFSEKDVRNNLNYVNVTLRGEDRKTLDVPSRLLLSKWASDSNGLHSVGLNWKVLYGFIHAESTWVPQEGIGKNGVKSHGLAQFEGATARSYGLYNAYDPLAAVFAAAALIKDAAQWTQARLIQSPLTGANPAQQAQALREGVSVYYNTGWKTRHAWSPTNSERLPDATKKHIINVKAGNMIAENLVADIKSGIAADTPSLSMQKDAVKRAEEMIANLRVSRIKTQLSARSDSLHDASGLDKKNVKTTSEQAEKPNIFELEARGGNTRGPVSFNDAQIKRAESARRMLAQISLAGATPQRRAAPG